MDQLAQVVAWTSNPYDAYVRSVQSCPFADVVVSVATASAFAAARVYETDFDRQSPAPNCWAVQGLVAVAALCP